MNSVSISQSKKQRPLKYQQRQLLFEGWVFYGGFNMSQKFNGDYYGGKAAVRIAPLKGGKTYVGVEYLLAQYKFNLLDTSTKGGGDGTIGEGALSFQWLRWSDTKMTNTRINLGTRHISEGESYINSNNQKYEKVEDHWLWYPEVIYEKLSTTSLFNKFVIGSRWEQKLSSSIKAQHTDSLGTVVDSTAVPQNKRTFQVYTEFGPSIPIDNQWMITVVAHVGYTYKSHEHQNIWPVGGVVSLSRLNSEIARVAVIPEFSAAFNDPKFEACVSVDALGLVRIITQ
jgi:hypothetical protein